MTNEERAEKLYKEINRSQRYDVDMELILAYSDEIRREHDKEYVAAMMKIIGHTALPPHPSNELLLGLIDSIKRISQAAIMGKE